MPHIEPLSSESQSSPVAEIRVGIVEKTTGIISKTVSLGPDGKPVSDASGCFIKEGLIGVKSVKGATGLAGLISTLKSNRALTLGVPPGVKAAAHVRLVTKDYLDARTPQQVAAAVGDKREIARTTEDVVFLNLPDRPN